MIAAVLIAAALQTSPAPADSDWNGPKDWPGPGELYYVKLTNPGPLLVVRADCDGYVEMRSAENAYYKRVERFERDFRATMGRDPQTGPDSDIATWEYNACDQDRTWDELSWAEADLYKAEAELRRYKRCKGN